MHFEKNDLFKPHHHIPKFSIALFQALMTPLLVYFTIVGNIIMFICAYAFYLFEKAVNDQVSTYWDALWWAICTVSTVGYGDVVPITNLGKITTAILIIFGVMFFLGFTATLVSVMLNLIGTEQHKK